MGSGRQSTEQNPVGMGKVSWNGSQGLGCRNSSWRRGFMAKVYIMRTCGRTSVSLF